MSESRRSELDALRESKAALIRKVKRLEDRVALLYRENEVLREERREADETMPRISVEEANAEVRAAIDAQGTVYG